MKLFSNMGGAKMHSFVLASTDFTFKRNGKSYTQQECQNLSLKSTRMSKLELEIIHIYIPRR
jgi:hypothetical protein